MGNRNSGRRKPLADHLRTGTYRPSRHGPRPGQVVPMVVAPAPWAPAPEDVVTLGEAGRRFLGRMLEAFECSAVEGVLLVEAAHCVDGLAIWRPLAATDKQASRLSLAHSKT